MLRLVAVFVVCAVSACTPSQPDANTPAAATADPNAAPAPVPPTVPDATSNGGGGADGTPQPTSSASGAGGAPAAAGDSGASCSSDSDCRLFSDYCTGCDCRALGRAAPDPTCSGPGVRCLVDPCLKKAATCSAGRCVVSGAAQ